jgi:hypothetical protein
MVLRWRLRFACGILTETTLKTCKEGSRLGFLTAVRRTGGICPLCRRLGMVVECFSSFTRLLNKCVKKMNPFPVIILCLELFLALLLMTLYVNKSVMTVIISFIMGSMALLFYYYHFKKKSITSLQELNCRLTGIKLPKKKGNFVFD